jgi:uncharacterized protein YbjQ (UPF0145 family)
MDPETVQALNLFFNFGWPILLLLTAYFIGTLIESNHFRRIRRRERELRAMPVVTFETLPDDWRPAASTLVTGSIVVSLDYFKRVIAGLRGLVGGRVKTYEPLLDRARREAVLRMIESARTQGFDAVYNVRLETSRLANSTGNGEGIAGIEMLAFGTAVKLESRFAPRMERF